MKLNFILLTSFFLLLFTPNSFAQSGTSLSLTLDPISNARFATEDALNLTVLSKKQDPANVYFEVRVRYESGFSVVVAKSQNVTLNAGANRFNKNNIRFVSKKYDNKDFGSFEQSNGFLPTGSYQVCVAVKCADRECLISTNLLELEGQQISDCKESFSINPTPLLLSSPFDEAELTTKRPNFSWIPPMPIGTDPNLSYTFTLIKLKDKQRGEAGIRRNRPIYTTEGLNVLNLPFPAELEDLETGKKYAWQVKAVLGSTPIQTSEVWEFEIIEEEEKVFPMPFVILKQTDDNIYNALNELKFTFKEEGINKSLNYKIKTLDGQKLKYPPMEVPIEYGNNALTIDLSQFNLVHKDYYLIEVVDFENKRHILKFRYYYKKDVK